jgi:hypothetical protein
MTNVKIPLLLRVSIQATARRGNIKVIIIVLDTVESTGADYTRWQIIHLGSVVDLRNAG